MDVGFNRLVAHCTRPPIDITQEAAGLKRETSAATPGCSSPEVKVNGQRAVNQSENPIRMEGVRD